MFSSYSHRDQDIKFVKLDLFLVEAVFCEIFLDEEKSKILKKIFLAKNSSKNFCQKFKNQTDPTETMIKFILQGSPKKQSI